MSAALADLVARRNHARRDLGAFLELVGRDERGAPLVLAEHHRAWLAHLDYCWERPDPLLAAIWAHWGSGKTSVAVGMLAHAIGQRPEVRAALICSSEALAKSRLRAVRQMIESPAYRALFPGVVPSAAASKWGETSFVVERRGHAPDPTLVALSVTSHIVGSRWDLVLADDVVDQLSAVEAERREKVASLVRDSLLGRLERGGRLWWIATPWATTDASHQLRGMRGTSTLIQRVSADLDRLEQVREEPGRPPVQLEPAALWERWSRRRLQARAEQDERAFRLGFMMDSFAASELTFPSAAKCVVPGARAEEWIRRGYWTYVGVDLAGEKRAGSAISVVGLDPQSQRRHVLEVLRGKWRYADLVAQLAGVAQRHRDLRVIFVENNAIQDQLVTMLQQEPGHARWANLVEGFTTGRNKNDLATGLHSLEYEFGRGMWLVPGGEFEGHRAGCACSWCAFMTELRLHPQAPTTDQIMSLWFAANAIRQWGVPMPRISLEGLNYR